MKKVIVVILVFLMCSLLYNAPDSLYRTKTKFIGTIGVRMNKVYEIHLLQQKIDLEWISSFGYAFLLFDDVRSRHFRKLYPENYEVQKNEIQAFLKTFSTFHLGQGLKITYKNVGFQIQYTYTPYHLFSDYIDKDFGSHSLIFGIFYRQ